MHYFGLVPYPAKTSKLAAQVGCLDGNVQSGLVNVGMRFHSITIRVFDQLIDRCIKQPALHMNGQSILAAGATRADRKGEAHACIITKGKQAASGMHRQAALRADRRRHKLR